MIKAVLYDMFETLITHFHGASPVYFGSEMAADAQIPEERFLPVWRESERDRSIGNITVEEVVMRILKENGAFSEEKLSMIMGKIRAAKEDCFRNMHPEILPMLEALKAHGILIGLVSNCYDNEAEVIRESAVYPYFDAVCFSCEEGLRKPDPEIFLRCAERLGVKPQECIYVGDGGAHELEASRALGMHAIQAGWYLKSTEWQPAGRMEEYETMDHPLELLKFSLA